MPFQDKNWTLGKVFSALTSLLEQGVLPSKRNRPAAALKVSGDRPGGALVVPVAHGRGLGGY